MSGRLFEWDPVKAASNFQKHGIDFDFAIAAFEDSLSIDQLEDFGGHEEERGKLIGSAGGILLAIIYTERDARTRIISARRATRKETDDYYR